MFEYEKMEAMKGRQKNQWLMGRTAIFHLENKLFQWMIEFFYTKMSYKKLQFTAIVNLISSW